MTAATATRPTTKTAQRKLSLLSWDARQGGLLKIVDGRQIDAYWIADVEAGHAERAIAFEKLDMDDVDVRTITTHTVSLEREGCACTCDGFRYRGTCRHLGAALKLIELGSI